MRRLKALSFALLLTLCLLLAPAALADDDAPTWSWGDVIEWVLDAALEAVGLSDSPPDATQPSPDDGAGVTTTDSGDDPEGHPVVDPHG